MPRVDRQKGSVKQARSDAVASPHGATLQHMKKTIGVRQLRQRASEFLRAVEQGASLEVTAHGRPVAQLAPVRPDDRRAVLVTRGRLRPADGDLLDFGAPLPAARNVPPASASLLHVRDDER
jgi:prevent-host-death family protein